MGPVNLQIRCSRCQVITPTFVEMKLHLLCVHEEELQLRVEEGPGKEKGRFLSGLPIYTSKETEQELYKHATSYWKQPAEKKPPVKCGMCDESFYSYAKLKKHMLLHSKEPHRLQARVLPKRPDEEVRFFTSLGYNCILCKLGCGSKVELIGHWQSYHNCEDPTVLWSIFSSVSASIHVDPEEWPGALPEHSTGGGGTCYGEPEGVAAAEQAGLGDQDRTSDCDCRVHSGSPTDGTVENHQLICPFCLKTFSCHSFGEEAAELEQEHQCPKCLVKFSLTAKGLGARVLCTSSKHCGRSTSASETEESVRSRSFSR